MNDIIKKLNLITKEHNAEEVKRILLSQKRNIFKFLKLDNDYGDELPEFIFYSKKHLDDGYYDFEINDMQFSNSFIRKFSVDSNETFKYICGRYNVFIETIKNKTILP